MAGVVAGQLRKSIAALLNNDADMANEVIYNEDRVNAYELKIDSDCEYIFALHTPVANDMRFVFSTLKINADLERIGDYAEGIAKLVLLSIDKYDPQLIKDLRVEEMYGISCTMMEDITTAYNYDDSRLARSVYTMDVQLNEINHLASETVVKYCEGNPGRILQAMHLLSMVRKLERVGDHITNIAEDIIFHKEAVVLKHSKIQPENDNGAT